MLSASIGCIAYLRGIFPDETFSEERYNAATTKSENKKHTPTRMEGGQRIMRLQRNSCPGAADLLDYLEHGVYDALQKQYLMSVVFSISVDPRHTSNIHEAYTFQFAYRANASPTIVVQDKLRGKSTTAMPLDAAKRSMQLLFRQLIAMTQSLSPLPEDANKFIALRLFFNEGTPDLYQPPGFRAASDTESARFVTHFEKDRPHDQQIGSIDTGFHACTLRITTIGDLDDEPGDRAQTIRIWDAEHNAKVAFKGLSLVNEHDEQLLQATFSSDSANEHQKYASCNQGLQTEVDTIMAGSELGQESLAPTQVLEESQAHDKDPTHRETRSQARHKIVQRNQALKQDATTNPIQHKSGESLTNSITAADCTNQKSSLDLGENSNIPEGCTDPRLAQELSSVMCSTLKDNPEDRQGDLITCECGDTSEDGLMVECDQCHGWSHLPCYVKWLRYFFCAIMTVQGYMQSGLAPGYIHKCYTCLIKDCADLENLRSIAIVRRALHSIWLDGYHCTSTREFGKSIGVKDLQTAASILQKLAREKWIIPLKSKALLRSTRQNKKKPTYTVLRTAENEQRLKKEYFDPSIGLERYKNTYGQSSVCDGPTEVDAEHEKHHTEAHRNAGAVSDIEMLTLNDSTVPSQQLESQVEAMARECCADVVCATPDLSIKPGKESQSVEVAGTELGENVTAPNNTPKIDTMVTSTATTEDEVDEDLSLPLANRIRPKTALSQSRREEELRPTKRVKVSIINKPVVSFAFDTMTN